MNQDLQNAVTHVNGLRWSEDTLERRAAIKLMNWFRSPPAFLKRERALQLKSYPWAVAARRIAMAPEVSGVFEVDEDSLSWANSMADADIDSISELAQNLMGKPVVLKLQTR